jgi:hypothetical protein
MPAHFPDWENQLGILSLSHVLEKMKLFRLPYFLVLSVLQTSSSSAQNHWILKKNKEGIQISTRQSDRSKFNDIKVEMDLPGNIYQLAAILQDIAHYPQWSYSTKKAVLIKKVPPDKYIYYSNFSAPWPVADRDLYSIMETKIDSTIHSLKVLSNGKSDYLPENSGLVRIPYSKSVWEITTLTPKVIHLIFVLEIDPGGSVPAWILNLFSTKGPLVTFENLKHKMALLNPLPPT